MGSIGRDVSFWKRGMGWNEECRIMNDEFGLFWRRPVRVVEEKEIKQFEEYRTRRLVLDAWDNMIG